MNDAEKFAALKQQAVAENEAAYGSEAAKSTATQRWTPPMPACWGWAGRSTMPGPP